MNGNFTDLHTDDVFFAPGQPIHDHQLNSIAIQTAAEKWSKKPEFSFKNGDSLYFKFGDVIREIEFGVTDSGPLAEFPATNNTSEVSVIRVLDKNRLRYFAIKRSLPKNKHAAISFKAKKDFSGLLRLEIDVFKTPAGTAVPILKWSFDNAQRTFDSVESLKRIPRNSSPVYVEKETSEGVPFEVAKLDNTFELNKGERVRVWDGIQEIKDAGTLQQNDNIPFNIEFLQDSPKFDDLVKHFWVVAGQETKNAKPRVALSQTSCVWKGEIKALQGNNFQLCLDASSIKPSKSNCVTQIEKSPASPPTKRGINDKCSLHNMAGIPNCPEALRGWLSSIDLEELSDLTKNQLFSQIRFDLGLREKYSPQWGKALDEILARRDAMRNGASPAETITNQEAIV